MSYNTLPLHETLNLYVSPTTYIFEPASTSLAHFHGGGAPTFVSEKNVRESLVVDRQSGKMSLNTASHIPFGKEKVITCYGIIGLLSLATTDFLLIITSRTPSCRLLSHPIYLAKDYRLLPLSPLSTSAAIMEHPVEKELIGLVEQGLKSGRFWFSYDWDLTNSLQRQDQLKAGLTNEGKKWPLWKRADERFFWNKFLSSRMIDLTENGGIDLSRFILPVMYGSVELRSANLDSRDLLFLLISRRSRYRAGTRYFTRGISESGHVANFNETEQIVLFDPLPSNGGVRRGRVDGRERLSFVQTRGSIPLFWAEVNNLRYKPDLQIMDYPETPQALKAHLNEMIQTYGQTYLVNLVNQKGHEQPIKEAFERHLSLVSSYPLIREKTHYLYFDFHHECKGLRFDRVSVLVDRLAEPLEDMGWYHSLHPPSYPPLSPSSTLPCIISQQTGVIRTNCMDCLDRTNVAQSALGQRVLNQQLRKVGLLSIKQGVEDHEDFMVMFRQVWTDHGNTVSQAYAGTGALKSDYTRTGKRSKEGMLEDGFKSIMRYIRNNFYDGDRQDAFDILTGAWVAKRGGIPPLTDTRPLLMRAMPYVLAFALTMIFAAVALPRTSAEHSIYSFLLIWLFLAFFSGNYIWGNGIFYVSWPRLNPPLEILSYSGPGARSIARGRGVSFAAAIPIFDRRRKQEAGAGMLESTVNIGREGRSVVYKMEELELGKRKGALIN
nr:inositol/phosphatidylinositol phosphatase [Cryptococcus depauperatus CBS 7855]